MDFLLARVGFPTDFGLFLLPLHQCALATCAFFAKFVERGGVAAVHLDRSVKRCVRTRRFSFEIAAPKPQDRAQRHQQRRSAEPERQRP